MAKNTNFNWKKAKPIIPSVNIPVKTLADMTEDEIKALEKQYGAKVQRPKKRAAEK